MNVSVRIEQRARARRVKHLLWLSAAIAVAGVAIMASAFTGAGEPLRARAFLAGVASSATFLCVTTIAAVFQRCPQCRKLFNVRSLVGMTWPYRAACVHCHLYPPSTTLGAGRSLMLTFFPGTLVTGVVALLHYGLASPTVLPATLATLPSLRDAFVTLGDGVPQPAYLGSYVHVTQGSRGRSGLQASYQIVPLVPADWTPAQPIKVWLWCNDGPETRNCQDPARWLSLLETAGVPGRSARVIAHADVRRTGSGWNLSVIDAERRHGVRTDPEALFVSWPEYPESL